MLFALALVAAAPPIKARANPAHRSSSSHPDETWVDWVQTARFKDGSTDLLKTMPTIEMEPMPESPTELTLEIDTSTTYQKIVGFGGAFTEASAINWKLLSKADQDEVIRLYFAPPEQGGHGYTLGRVPMNSCDFSPASYSFDDVEGDLELEHFDTGVKHDVEVGMVAMIKEAQDTVEARGHKLSLYASPWSPPAWMKLPAWGKQSMLLSDSPNCLMPSMQRTWAKYFSKFIDAYRAQGIDMWGVTVQNEPEAAVGWEACLWTPTFMATFVRDHLGPVLEADHPGVKIIGFDHNKDHVDIWAKGLYADPEAAKYFYGVGVHWYGGLNTKNLDYVHHLDTTKAILATEACNCGGVIFKDATFTEGEIVKGNFLATWWSRAESLALDILEDLRFWAVGWTDWNLVLSISGGPNHLKNLCDANIITDHDQQLGGPTLIMQASYYYMGHFTRYFPPGAVQVDIKNSVEVGMPPLEPGDVKNGQALLFTACDGNNAQRWKLDAATGAILIPGTNEAESSDGYQVGGECMDAAQKTWTPGKIQSWTCTEDTPAQVWELVTVTGGSQIFHQNTSTCLTAVTTKGSDVGLDQGVTVVAAQLKPCLSKGHPSQTFAIEDYDGQGFPNAFPVRTLAAAPGGGDLCLQPQIVQTPHFDAVAFQSPDGSVALVAMNVGDNPQQFTIVDKQAKAGMRELVIPPHAIQTYRWHSPSAAKASAEPVARAAAVGASQQPPATAAAVAAPQGTSAASEGRPTPGQLPTATIAAASVDQMRQRGGASSQRPEYFAAARTELAAAAAASRVDDGRADGSSVKPPLTGVFLGVVAAIAALALAAMVVRKGRSAAADVSGEWSPCEQATDYEEFSARAGEPSE